MIVAGLLLLAVVSVRAGTRRGVYRGPVGHARRRPRLPAAADARGCRLCDQDRRRHHRVAVIPPSFTALRPHLATATWHLQLTLALLIAGVLGSYAGAHLSSRHATDTRLKQGFGLAIVLATAYRVITL